MRMLSNLGAKFRVQRGIMADVAAEYLSKAKKLWESDERKWLVSFRSPLEIWEDNPTFLMLEIVTYVWAFLLYRHGN